MKDLRTKRELGRIIIFRVISFDVIKKKNHIYTKEQQLKRHIYLKFSFIEIIIDFTILKFKGLGLNKYKP